MSTRAERERQKMQQALRDVRALAEIVGVPLTPLREHEPFGLKVRIEQEHRRLLGVQHDRDRQRQAQFRQTFDTQTQQESEAQIRAFWNE